jgi:hypothetical protein
MPNLPQRRGFEANSEVHLSQSLVLPVGALDGLFLATLAVAPLRPEAIPARQLDSPDRSRRSESHYL